MQQPSYPQPPPLPPAAAPPPAVVVLPQAGPSMLVRVIWYLLIGWWLAGLASAVAYALALTIIGLPFALMIFNRLPAILTLRPATQRLVSQQVGGVTVMQLAGQAQHPLWLRALYFLLVGWWVAGLWLSVAYFLLLLVLTIPLGLMMYNRIGGVLTLYRY